MGRGAAAAAPRPAPARPRAPRPTPAPRRRSGRTRSTRAHAAPASLPLRVWQAPFARGARARTGRVLDALLSGRGWIALVFLLLAGIVFFNVDLLQMNRDIARNSERISALKRENSALLLDQARLAGSERIQEEAMKLGLVLPAPGEVRYLKARPAQDARRAAKRIAVPSGEPSSAGAAEGASTGAAATGSEGAAGIDPVTGFPVDPATGAPVYDPVTGAPLDPATGEPLDLSTLGASGAPAPDATATPAPTGTTPDPTTQPVG